MDENKKPEVKSKVAPIDQVKPTEKVVDPVLDQSTQTPPENSSTSAPKTSKLDTNKILMLIPIVLGVAYILFRIGSTVQLHNKVDNILEESKKSNAETTPTPTPDPFPGALLFNSDETALKSLDMNFTIKYPSDWEYVINSQGDQGATFTPKGEVGYTVFFITRRPTNQEVDSIKPEGFLKLAKDATLANYKEVVFSREEIIKVDGEDLSLIEFEGKVQDELVFNITVFTENEGYFYNMMCLSPSKDKDKNKQICDNMINSFDFK